MYPAGWNSDAQKGGLNIGNTFPLEIFDRVQNTIANCSTYGHLPDMYGHLPDM